MIGRFATRIEQQVVVNIRATAGAVVEIDCSSRNVEDDVFTQLNFSCNGLKVKRRLFLDVSNFVNKISNDFCVSGKLSARGIREVRSTPSMCVCVCVLVVCVTSLTE